MNSHEEILYTYKLKINMIPDKIRVKYLGIVFYW